MSNSKMEEEEEKYYAKSREINNLLHKMNWVITIVGFLVLVFAIAAFGNKAITDWIFFGCGTGILVTAIVLKKRFKVKANTYYRKACTLTEERKKREEREKHEEQEKRERICANEGHIFVEQPYENMNFEYKPELFTCLPLDFCVTERCSRCGVERKKIKDGFDKNRKLGLSPKMECPILYNDKVVGHYVLYLSLDKSYSMQAKRDIPSIGIKKGDLCLVLNPFNDIYYNEEGLSISPDKQKEQADRIYDDGEMPKSVELEKYIAFVDDETHDILSMAEITVENIAGCKYFGKFNIGILRIPEKGSLKVFCVIRG